MKFAITGANGQIGFFLVNFLRQQGYEVYELVRSPEKVINKAYYQFFDLSQPDKIPSLQNIDVLIHAAHFFDLADKNYESINRIGTQKLFRQAEKDGVKYSIFISSISAHAKAISLYGRAKYRLEQMLKAQNVAVVRPGLIFHNPLHGITAAIDKFVKLLPVVPLIGLGNQLIYPCLLVELAQLLLTLSIKKPVLDNPIVAAARNSITFKRLVKYLAKQHNKFVLLIPIPCFGIYYLLKTLEMLGIRIKLKSDSLLSIQYPYDIDFSESDKLTTKFSSLDI